MTIHIRATDSGSKNGYARGICGQVRPRVLVPTLEEWRAYPEGRICRRCVQIGAKVGR